MNKKQIIEYSITAALVVVFVVLLVKRPKKAKEETSAAKEIPAVPAEGTPSGAAARDAAGPRKDIDDILVLQQEKAALEWGRDPFFFEITKKVYKGQSLLLRGVSVGENDTRYAYINDAIVTVGESVEGYMVLEIQKDKVLLRRGVDSFYLGLPEE